MDKVRYLCPICDHELVARGFCPSCKKTIKKPVEYKGGYLPNEDSGNYVLNRNVSGVSSSVVGGYASAQTARSVNSNNYSRTTYTGRTSPEADFGNCGGHVDSDYGIPNVDPHAKKKSGKGTGLSIFFWILFIMAIVRAIMNYLNS